MSEKDDIFPEESASYLYTNRYATLGRRGEPERTFGSHNKSSVKLRMTPRIFQDVEVPLGGSF